MNKDIVNPIPARNETPTIRIHVSPEGIEVTPDFTAIQVAKLIPNGYPITNPKKIPSSIGWMVGGISPSKTPELARMKIGTIANAVQ